MGFYTNKSVYECREHAHPPSGNRVWDFSDPSPICTWQSASQVLDLHLENRPTPTIIVSGVRYYGFRYYSPELGRWMSRDPIGENGFEIVRTIASSHTLLTLRRNSRRLFFNGHVPEIGFRSAVLAIENGHPYLAFLNNSLSWGDPHGLIIIGYIPPFEKPCPAYCCDCDFAEVDALIASQKKIIDQLKRIIEEEGDLSPFDPRIKQWANAGGGRSEGYHQSSACIQYATDRLENNIFRSIGDVFRMIESFAEMEIGRSETFTKFLEEVKRACKNCGPTHA